MAKLEWDPTRWRNFTALEFQSRGGGEPLPLDLPNVPRFLDRLQMLREACGFPFNVSSGYRTPEYNNQISKTGLNGPHTTGRAVDILAVGEQAFHLVHLAPLYGFTRMGVDQNGAHGSRYIHLDDLEAEDGFPSPWVWTYG